ncbi:MAG: hypothetical protein KGL39_18185 [Patescibacteria group bacterium]|nr:hypothetical protein [Patescibacteria group bacterium]
MTDETIDLSTFDKVTAWIESDILPEIRNTFTEAGEAPFCGFMFTTMGPNNEVYDNIIPSPVMFDGIEAIESENKDEFVEQLTELLAQTASSGILIILPSIMHGENENPEECVIATLEHKGGRKSWVAYVEDGKLDDFKVKDINWGEGSAFHRLLPFSGMN